MYKYGMKNNPLTLRIYTEPYVGEKNCMIRIYLTKGSV